MTVTLIKPHTHAGLDYQPGDTLDVDEATARWLIELGVAEAAQKAVHPMKPRKGETP